MTLYLKYRPQKISELDLLAVRDHLGKIITSESLPHAFLFTGPRGTGKTSSARILAKAINCLHPQKDGEPCNNCDMCLQIASGSALDIVEIDAASNRGIDEIRDLREKIKLAPLSAKYKVYIIDEVHMLTTEAFNALLKTLEEPPAHAIFILCTTEFDKLPETVVSRCTLVRFSRPSVSEIVEKLQTVVKIEKLQVSEPDLKLIAHSARGSFRDAIKVLEQVQLSGQSASQTLGMLDSVQPTEFIEQLRNNQTQQALEMVARLVEQGGNVRGFIERCVDALREELLANSMQHKPVDASMTLIKAFETAYTRSRDTAVPQLPLEILVIENTSDEKQPSAEKVAVKGVGEKEDEVKQPKEAEPQTQQAEIIKETVTIRGGANLDELVTKWPEILKAVRPKNHSVEALLRSTRPVNFDGELLTLEVFYKFHKDKLETDRCRSIVEEAVGDVMQSKAVRVRLELGQRTKQEEVSAEAIEEDLVKAAEEIFKVDAI